MIDQRWIVVCDACKKTLIGTYSGGTAKRLRAVATKTGWNLDDLGHQYCPACVPLPLEGLR